MIKTFTQLIIGDAGGIEVKLPIITLGDGKPTGLIVANQHGGETSGILVIEELTKKLAKLFGTLIIVPSANPLGLLFGTRNEPVDGKDLNRSFPGNKTGDIPARLAAAIYDLAMQANFVIDLHTFSRQTPIVGIQVKNGDQTVLNQTTNMLKAFCPDVVWQIDSATKTDAHFAGALDEVCCKQGIPAIGIEMPKAAFITQDEIDRVTEGIIQILSQFGMVPQTPPKPAQSAPICQIKTIFSEISGIFTPKRKPLDRVKKGQIIGEITSIINLKKTQIFAPADGLLVTIAGRDFVRTGTKIGSLGHIVGMLDRS